MLVAQAANRAAVADVRDPGLSPYLRRATERGVPDEASKAQQTRRRRPARRPRLPPRPGPGLRARIGTPGVPSRVEAQRPELSTGNGPDVLWAIGDLKYLVLEAKSGATSDKIWRSDVAQLAHSMNWFQQTYDQSCSATPVMLHRVNTLEYNAVAPPGTRIITTGTMGQLADAVRKATMALADAGSWSDPKAVAEQYTAQRLLPQGLAQRFSVTPR
ncbi:hypothetical protein ABZV41_21125 [Streptomyces sp. NPDC005098]|uniref:hypothetical protein n=1 Tax=Streptomyces sp. NPDC005098 TaxID=3154560 RepID=UPI0033AB144B